MRADKLIVTNVSALRAKYGEHYSHVAAAVGRLIAADAARGLATRVVGIDSKAELQAVGGRPVRDPSNQEQAKAAIDALHKAYKPDYLMILGASDVVPFQELVNPMLGDGDKVVPSDLPYACNAPHGTSARAFLGPTRVVGRLPDVVGRRDPAYFVRVLGTATRWHSRKRSEYQDYFGVSAQVWQDSTARSLINLFGSIAAMEISPPRGTKYSDAQLARRVHYINCHGANCDPHFYGQRGTAFPPAHSARALERKVSNGTIVAAECCYGAQLYDPAACHGQLGISNTYLFDGAYGFFGSSTIAYGPSEGNGQADFLCQYFVEAVLGGASLGRAALEARHRFVSAYTHLDPSDLKTIAQFYLLGDPSIHPVAAVTHALSRSKSFKEAFKGAKITPGARALRRERLVRTGTNLAETLGAVTPSKGAPGARVRRVLDAAARESGLRDAARASFKLAFPREAAKGELKEFERAREGRSIHLLLGDRGRARDGHRRIVALIATVQNGELIHLRRVHSR